MNTIEKAIEKLLSQSGKTKQNGTRKGQTLGGEASNQDKNEGRLLKFDMSALESLGYVIPHKARTGIAEEFRIIKRPIIRNMQGKGAESIEHGNLIMLTSSIPNEGKTFTTLNLALSMVAEKDYTVLLIDCDVVNPTLSKMLGLDSKLGLTDILNNKVSVEDVIYSTDIPNLRFMPAGTIDTYSTELLASEKMRELMSELSERYSDRFVLFDSPPLLVTSQSVVLSHVMGQVVLVVEAGKTPENIVHDAVGLLDENDIVGIVLNKSRSSSLGGYYYGAYDVSYSK